MLSLTFSKGHANATKKNGDMGRLTSAHFGKSAIRFSYDLFVWSILRDVS